MDAIDKLVEHTGLSLPLAAQIVDLIMDSGASLLEVQTALWFVDRFILLLPIPPTPDLIPQ